MSRPPSEPRCDATGHVWMPRRGPCQCNKSHINPPLDRLHDERKPQSTATPGPATEGGLEDDVRALLRAGDNLRSQAAASAAFCGAPGFLCHKTIARAMKEYAESTAAIRARLGAGGGT